MLTPSCIHLRTMPSKTVDPIDCSHPPPSCTVLAELHILHCVNAAYKLQDLLQQLGLEHASIGMPDQPLRVNVVFLEIYSVFHK